MSMISWVLTLGLLFLGGFMILLVLLQRGRGGGLVGALGGAGGESAFGTRAGDVFTWVTSGVAVLWVLAAGIAGIMLRSDAVSPASTLPTGTIAAPDSPADLPSGAPLDDADLTPPVDTAPAPPKTDAAGDAADANAEADGEADMSEAADSEEAAAEDADAVEEVPAAE